MPVEVVDQSAEEARLVLWIVGLPEHPLTPVKTFGQTPSCRLSRRPSWWVTGVCRVCANTLLLLTSVSDRMRRGEVTGRARM